MKKIYKNIHLSSKREKNSTWTCHGIFNLYITWFKMFKYELYSIFFHISMRHFILIVC